MVRTFTALESENINKETAIRKAEELQCDGYTVMSISRRNIPVDETDGDWTVAGKREIGYEIVAVWVGEAQHGPLPEFHDLTYTCP